MMEFVSKHWLGLLIGTMAAVGMILVPPASAVAIILGLASAPVVAAWLGSSATAAVYGFAVGVSFLSGFGLGAVIASSSEALLGWFPGRNSDHAAHPIPAIRGRSCSDSALDTAELPIAKTGTQIPSMLKIRQDQDSKRRHSDAGLTTPPPTEAQLETQPEKQSCRIM